MSLLETLLRAAAAVQLALALVNFGLVRLMGWKPDLEKLPLLAKEVFHVHLWFIGITCAIFGSFTWIFASEIASGSDPAARWLAGAIAIFWGIRAALQIVYYSPSHWKGSAAKTLAHILCFAGYGGISLIYAQACWSLAL